MVTIRNSTQAKIGKKWAKDLKQQHNHTWMAKNYIETYPVKWDPAMAWLGLVPTEFTNGAGRGHLSLTKETALLMAEGGKELWTDRNERMMVWEAEKGIRERKIKVKQKVHNPKRGGNKRAQKPYHELSRSGKKARRINDLAEKDNITRAEAKEKMKGNSKREREAQNEETKRSKRKKHTTPIEHFLEENSRPNWGKNKNNVRKWQRKRQKAQQAKQEKRRHEAQGEREGTDDEAEHTEHVHRHIDDVDREDITERLSRVDIGSYIRIRRPGARGDTIIEGDVMDMRRTREGAHLYREPDVLRITTSDNGTWVTVDVREPWSVILDPEHLETPENEPEWKQRIRDESSTRNWRIPTEAVLMPAELAWGKSLGSSDGREYAWAGARRRKRRKRSENVDSELSNELYFPTIEPKAELILQQINDKDHPDHETSSALWADCTVEIETYDEQMPHALGRQGTPI
jgi:hypothetical protein